MVSRFIKILQSSRNEGKFSFSWKGSLHQMTNDLTTSRFLHRPHDLLDPLSHVAGVRSLPIDSLASRATMEYLLGVKHELRNPAFSILSGHDLQFLVAQKASRKKRFGIRPEPKGLQDGRNLKNELTFLDDDDVPEKQLGLEFSVSSQDDSLLLTRDLNKSMEVPPFRDSDIITKGSQPFG